MDGLGHVEARALEPVAEGRGLKRREDDNRMQYTLGIQQLDRGYLVEVGCKRFAIETREDLLKYVTEYISKPVETESKFYEGSLFK